MSHSLRKIELMENPEQRCPCVLLLDTSGSMSGPRIAALNEGLRVLHENLASDSLASRRVELAIVTFDSMVSVVQDFATVDQFKPPTLGASGNTVMGAGIERALDLITERKRDYRNHGITYFRPWIFMITDGAPTDNTEKAALRIKDEEAKKGVAFFAIGVQEADMAKLQEISEREPKQLRGLEFQELFVWLSASMQRASQAKPDEQIGLPSTGWSTV